MFFTIDSSNLCALVYEICFEKYEEMNCEEMTFEISNMAAYVNKSFKIWQPWQNHSELKS